MDEGAGGGEVGGNGVALAKMAGWAGPVAGEGGGGGCTSGRDGDCAKWIFGEEVYAVLEGSGQGVELTELARFASQVYGL